MKMLIVQVSGYYGVNIRIITDDQFNRMTVDFDDIEDHQPGPPWKLWTANDGTEVIVCDVPTDTTSAGCDSGWWRQGEALIEQLLNGDLHNG